MSTSTEESHKLQQALFEETIRKWWNKLDDARGIRAELRRCASIKEVMFRRGYYQLRRDLLGTKWCDRDGLAAVAGILVHVKNDNPNSKSTFVGSMAQPKEVGSNTPRVSELRFRRLLKSEPDDDLFIHLIRAVRLLDKTAPVTDLAVNIYNLYKWTEDTRQRWAFQYYEKLVSNE